MVREGFSKAIYRHMRVGGAAEKEGCMQRRATDTHHEKKNCTVMHANVCVYESGAPGDTSNVCSGVTDVSIRREYV